MEVPGDPVQNPGESTEVEQPATAPGTDVVEGSSAVASSSEKVDSDSVIRAVCSCVLCAAASLLCLDSHVCCCVPEQFIIKYSHHTVISLILLVNTCNPLKLLVQLIHLTRVVCCGRHSCA